jgi:hypothetical protein
MVSKYFKVKPGLETSNIHLVTSNASVELHVEDGSFLIASPVISESYSVSNVAVIDSEGYWVGPAIKSWITYVTSYSSTPVFLQTISGGDVYTYKYNSDATTAYRFIASDNSLDAFYGSFDGSNLSDLLVTKATIL